MVSTNRVGSPPAFGTDSPPCPPRALPRAPSPAADHRGRVGEAEQSERGGGGGGGAEGRSEPSQGSHVGRTEIRVGGLGGQGVILCGSIIGKAAAIYSGRHAALIQAFGPEARGSACSAQVIVADEAIGYPYVRRPDILVLLSQDAFVQFSPQLKPDGVVLYENELVQVEGRLPTTARSFGIPATRFAEELGRRLVLNIVMAGFFTGVTNLLSIDAVEKAVVDSVPKGTESLNLKALMKGYEYGRGLITPA